MAVRVHNPSGGTRADGMAAFGGATAVRAGHAGAVPAPAAGEQNYVLLGSGGFGLVQVSDIYDFLGDGAGAFVSVQEIINAIVSALQSRTVWHRLDGSGGGGGESGGGGSTPSSGTMMVDTYNITGVGQGQEVSAQQLMDAAIARFDGRTTWNILQPLTPSTSEDSEEGGGESGEEPEASQETDNTDENSINLNEESSGNDLYDQIQNNYEENSSGGSGSSDSAAE